MKSIFNKRDEKKLPEPELKRIPIQNLRFAPYQRELKPSKVRKIVDNFIPDIVGIALVSFRNGEFWCMDAQHRIKALEKLGYKELLCQVITDLTYEEECLRFNILNTGRTQLTANQIFHCRVEEKDKDAIALVEAFKRYRFDYNKNSAAKDDNVIGAVSKFVKIQKTYGIEMVDRVLWVLRNAWFGDKNSLSSAIISGVATFLGQTVDVDLNVLVKALERTAPNELIMSANAFVKFSILRPGRSDSTCYHIAKQIDALYKNELARNKKIGMKELEREITFSDGSKAVIA